MISGAEYSPATTCMEAWSLMEAGEMNARCRRGRGSVIVRSVMDNVGSVDRCRSPLIWRFILSSSSILRRCCASAPTILPPARPPSVYVDSFRPRRVRRTADGVLGCRLTDSRPLGAPVSLSTLLGHFSALNHVSWNA